MRPTAGNPWRSVMNNLPFSRRHFIRSSACGFGCLALAGLAAADTAAPGPQSPGTAWPSRIIGQKRGSVMLHLHARGTEAMSIPSITNRAWNGTMAGC